jgi:hypothetical protein
MGLRRWNREQASWESFGTAQNNPATIGAAAAIHASQHAVGAADFLSPSVIGAVSTTAGSVTSAPTNAAVVRNIFTSTLSPSGGSDGDVWLKYS